MLGQSLRQLRNVAFGAAVAPDGMHIVFTSHGIWVMDSQGSNPQKVLAFGENEFAMNAKVRWSPDGQRLAYIKARRAAESYECEIETCDLKGASRTVVLSGPDLFDLFLASGRANHLFEAGIQGFK